MEPVATITVWRHQLLLQWADHVTIENNVQWMGSDEFYLSEINLQ
jgi:hypothetical protein